MREIISNLYKIKWGEKESKYKKEKMMKNVMVKQRVVGDKEEKEGKGWRKCNSKCGLIGRRKVFFLFYLFFKQGE